MLCYARAVVGAIALIRGLSLLVHRPPSHRVNITHPDRCSMGCGAACTGVVPPRVATAAGHKAAPIKEATGDVGIGKKSLGEFQEGVNKVWG